MAILTRRSRCASLHLFRETMSERTHFDGFAGRKREDFAAGPIPPFQPGGEMARPERQRRMRFRATPRITRRAAGHAHPEIRKYREMRAPDWHLSAKDVFEFGIESCPRVKPLNKPTDALSSAKSFIECDSAGSGQGIRRHNEIVAVQWT